MFNIIFILSITAIYYIIKFCIVSIIEMRIELLQMALGIFFLLFPNNYVLIITTGFGTILLVGLFYAQTNQKNFSEKEILANTKVIVIKNLILVAVLITLFFIGSFYVFCIAFFRVILLEILIPKSKFLKHKYQEHILSYTDKMCYHWSNDGDLVRLNRTLYIILFFGLLLIFIYAVNLIFITDPWDLYEIRPIIIIGWYLIVYSVLIKEIATLQIIYCRNPAIDNFKHYGFIVAQSGATLGLGFAGGYYYQNPIDFGWKTIDESTEMLATRKEHADLKSLLKLKVAQENPGAVTGYLQPNASRTTDSAGNLMMVPDKQKFHMTLERYGGINNERATQKGSV